MTTRTTWFAMVALGQALACGGGDGAPGPAGGGDAATTTPVDAGSPDAALVAQETRIDDSSVVTCAAGCAALGIGCADRCEFGATYAAYGNYNEFGFIDAVATVEDPSCERTVPQDLEVDGLSYPRAIFACCCQVPEVTVVEGDPATRKSCDDTCAAAGFGACGDFHDWMNGGSNGASNGGVEMRYVRQETGSSYTLVAGCAHMPAASVNAAGAERTLADYRCACHAGDR